ncbi:hypothetical protein ACIQ7Q_11785 [Streptomyces sp. NPDC096176]|uniref:hypothetical protein n=1 Tax=Streptomyces sp. NPDC096176 TaxID=3366079 RepID=UPI0037F4141D
MTVTICALRSSTRLRSSDSRRWARAPVILLAERLGLSSASSSGWQSARVCRACGRHGAAATRAASAPYVTAGRAWCGLSCAGAVLLDFEFTGRRVETATFTGTRFVGGANFAHAEFIQHGHFHGARFEQGSAHFLGAWFGSRVVFLRTDFGDKPAVFDGATFAGMTFFDGAIMGGGVSFEAARALAEFNRNWGSIRQWPEGWTERQLAADERMPLLAPKFSHWPEVNLPPGCSTWTLIVPDDGSTPTD